DARDSGPCPAGHNHAASAQAITAGQLLALVRRRLRDLGQAGTSFIAARALASSSGLISLTACACAACEATFFKSSCSLDALAMNLQPFIRSSHASCLAMVRSSFKRWSLRGLTDPP